MTQDERNAFAQMRYATTDIGNWDALPEVLRNHIAQTDEEDQPFTAQVFLPSLGEDGTDGQPVYMLWYGNINRAAIADGDTIVWTFADDRKDAIRRFATNDLRDKQTTSPG